MGVPQVVPYIPEPIIQDLLSRLPVKPLLRFRSVCKSWRAIMSERQFVKHHLKRALEKVQSQRLFFVSSNRLFIQNERNQEIDDDDVDDGDIVAVQLGLPYDGTLSTYLGERIFGSCNGLVCLIVNSKIHLINPSTREFKRIPGPYSEPYRKSGPRIRQLEACGFAYDSDTDDYKVVVICYPGSVSLFSVSVYSLRQKRWDTILEFPYKQVSKDSETATFLNGALHWLVRGELNDSLVVAVHLSTKQITEIPLPDILTSNRRLVLGTIKNNLCVFHADFREHDEYWRMKEKGGSSSWKRFRITLSYLHLQPLRSGEDSKKVLMKAYERLIMYDRRNNTYKEVRLHGCSMDMYSKAVAYVDSLVSPNM